MSTISMVYVRYAWAGVVLCARHIRGCTMREAHKEVHATSLCIKAFKREGTLTRSDSPLLKISSLVATRLQTH